MEYVLLANFLVLSMDAASLSSSDYHESSLLALDRPQTGKTELFLEELDAGRETKKPSDIDEVCFDSNF